MHKTSHFLLQILLHLSYLKAKNTDTYKIVLDRLEIINYQENRTKLEAVLFWANRTSRAVNVTYHLFQDCCGNDEEVQMTFYEFLSNEYRPYAINIKRRACDFLNMEYRLIFFKDFSKPGNTAMPKGCPVKKGAYHLYNYYPSFESFKNMPFKKCKLEFTYLAGGLPVYKFISYQDIDRDAKYREN